MENISNNQKNFNSFFKSVSILMIGTIISKLLGFIREWIVAYQFGAGEISDAFSLTNSIPIMVFTALATAININFIPTYIKIDDKNEKNRFTSNIINIFLLILFIGLLLIELFPQLFLFIFAAGLSGKTKIYSICMLRIVAFSIFPIILNDIFQAYSQANGFFKSTAVFGIVSNLVMIITTVFTTEDNYYFLSFGTIFANFIGMLISLYGSKKIGFRYDFKIDFNEKYTKKLLLLTTPLLVENLASNLSLLVDKNLASYLDSGTISSIGYAGTLGNIATTMIASSIITAVFPRFSKYASKNDYIMFESEIIKYGSILCFILAPISIFMIFWSKEIVVAVFQHGAFSNSASKMVGEAMAAYAIGVLPCGLQSYLIRVFYSLQNTKTPVIVKVFALFCNIILNLILVINLKHVGIALSTSISYFISYLILFLLLKNKIKIFRDESLNKSFFRSIFYSVISAISIRFLSNLFIINNKVIYLLIFGLAFLFVYTILVFLFEKKYRVIFFENIKNSSMFLKIFG